MFHKTWLLKVSNLVLYAALCLLLSTGILLTWQMKYGYFGGEAYYWLGLSREFWKNTHLLLSLPLIFLTGLHIILNVQWLKKVAAQNHSWRWILGIVGGLLLCLLPFLIPGTQS